MTAEHPMLAARDLNVAVGGRRLIDSLELSIQPGSVTVLLGCNGSGKTLCLLSLAGMRGADTAAAVCIGGAPLSTLPRRAIARQMGFLPQDSGSEAVGTLLDFVALGLYPWQGATNGASADDSARQCEALRRVGLAERAEQEVASLSGGERRRLDLALLLVQRAPLWLLDEPTNHLDPAQQAILLDLLREHRAGGGATLLSLHDPSLAAAIADQVLLLAGDGRWECGPVAAMLTPEKLSQLYQTPISLSPRFGPVFEPATRQLGR
jgi:iron complex transport system ATP-binding protein